MRTPGDTVALTVSCLCVLQTCFCLGFFLSVFYNYTVPRTDINLHKRILFTQWMMNKKKNLRHCLAKSFFFCLAALKLSVLYVNAWFECPLVALSLSQCIYWFTSIHQSSSMFIKQLVITDSVLDVKDHSHHPETNKQGIMWILITSISFGRDVRCACHTCLQILIPPFCCLACSTEYIPYKSN